MTDYEDGIITPGVVGKLSCLSLTMLTLLAMLGRCPRLTVTVGPYGMLSPSDSESVGPVGLYGMLSPSDSEFVGLVGLYGTLSSSDSDSVGPYGMLSPSDSGGPVGPDGTLSLSYLAGILFPAVPAGIPFPVGLDGPVGTLSPSDSDCWPGGPWWDAVHRLFLLVNCHQWILFVGPLRISGRLSVDAPCSLCGAGIGVAPENQTCPSSDAASTSPGGIGR